MNLFPASRVIRLLALAAALAAVPASRAATPVSQVALGDRHTCARLSTGRVQCWGANTSGALGIGDASVSLATYPRDVPTLASGVTGLSSRDFSSCAIVSGALRCWGSNAFGQVGDGTNVDRPAPTAVTGMSTGVTAVSVGYDYACAVVSGAARCWGFNDEGQLGDGATTARNTPITVNGLSSGVVSVAAGGHHACALLSSGAVKCWGRGSEGQLGGGTFTSGPQLPTTVTPVAGFTVAEIAAGNYHTCARSTAGAVRCWGWNGNGQLGMGATAVGGFFQSPQAVSGLSSGASALAAGASSTCAVVAGAARCWGWNFYGQLGTGDTADRPVPATVTGLASGVSGIDAGGFHSCAVMSAGGLQCWGYGSFGQLGNGGFSDSGTPVVAYIDASKPGAPTITSLVPGNLSVTAFFTPSAIGELPIITYAILCTSPGLPSAYSSIVSASPHTLPLPANGVPFSCQVSATNALGDGPYSAPQSVTPVSVPDPPRLSNVTPGLGSLAVSFDAPADGYSPLTGYVARCVNGAQTRTATAPAGANLATLTGLDPVPYRCTVSATNAVGEGPPSTPWRAVTPDAGGFAPIAPARDVVRFRARAVGTTGPPVNLVLSNTSPATRAFQLSTSSGEFSVLGCGIPSAIAVTTSAALSLPAASSCTLELRFTPAVGGTRTGELLVSVSGWLNARAVKLAGYGSPVSGGFDHTLQLLPSGTVSASGGNDAGQLGNGSTINGAFPASVAGLADIVAVAAGAWHSVALAADGTVWTWGRNDYGQLGYASAATCRKRRSTLVISIVDEPAIFACSTVAQPVPGLTNAVAVSAGMNTTFVLRSDGSLWSFGLSRRGALSRDNGRVPYAVPGPVVLGTSDVVEIASGGLHTLARHQSGAVSTLGATAFGEGPSSVLSGLPPVKSIAAGFAHNLALAQDGTVWSWGWGTWGQLGNTGNVGYFHSRSSAQAVPGLANVVEVTAGWATSFARRADGATFAWGNDTGGQLGLGVPAPDGCLFMPDIIVLGSLFNCAKSPLLSAGLANLAGVYAGMGHTIGPKPDGSRVAFGANGAGQWGRTGGNYGQIDLLGAFDEGSRTVAAYYWCDQCGQLSGGTEPSAASTGSRSTSGTATFEPTTNFSFGGIQRVGTAAASQVVQLTNTAASGSFDVTGVSVTGDFSASGCGGALAAAQTCAITLGFTPTAQGPRTGTITLLTTQASAPSITFDVGGFGIDVPGAPVSVSAAAGDTRATIAFSPPASDGGVPIDSYTATCNPGNRTASATLSPITVTGLANDVLHTCAVHASSPVGSGPVSASVTVTPNDGLPKTLAVTRTGSGSGTVTSTPAGIQCGAACASSYAVGAEVTLVATPSAGSWFTGWGGDCAGTGACTVTMGAARTVSAGFTTTPALVPRLGNISTRMQVLTGDNVLIGGFVIGGTLPKTVVVRARGPSLAPFGITNALANPTMQLYSGQTVIASNDDFGSAANLAALNASGFAPANALESAILVTLNPGGYTAVVSGDGGTTGVGIIEVFEVDRPETPLVNISTRGQVLTGNDVMIGGFVIQGSSPQTVIVRARGPSLVPFGIANALADPVLQLFSGQTVIASNDDWQASPDAASIDARGFAPANAKESAILVTLPPGAYTAIVTGRNGGTGVGLIEVFAQ